jgi:hypothetical protein
MLTVNVYNTETFRIRWTSEMTLCSPFLDPFMLSLSIWLSDFQTCVHPFSNFVYSQCSICQILLSHAFDFSQIFNRKTFN